jgi:hypothetical protein
MTTTNDPFAPIPVEGFNESRVRLLVYGESGVGKTVLASTFPKPVFLDIDDGMASVTPGKAARWFISTWAEMYEKVALLLSTHPDDIPYDTIVIDNLNELQSLAMKHIVTAFPTVKRAYGSQPGMSDYGMMMNIVDDMVRGLKSLEKRVIFLAQVKPREFETDLVMPQMVGKNTSQNICRMMDVIGYLFKADVEGRSVRQIAFDASNYVTKDRSGRLPPIVEIRHKDSGYEDISQHWK